MLQAKAEMIQKNAAESHSERIDACRVALEEAEQSFARKQKILAKELHALRRTKPA